MNKVTILLCSTLLATTGCNTQQVMDTNGSMESITKAATSMMPSSKDADQQSQASGGDIEDASCAKIRYEKRTTCRVQVHLNSLGYKVGSADGIAGKKTRSGIRKFQSKHDIKPVDGKSSFKLLTRLREENASGTNPLFTGVLAATACGGAAALMKQDAVMWAMICGAGGVIMQDLSTEGKKDYAARYYEIKDENERTENEINQLAKQTQASNNRTKSYQSEIKGLIANEKNDKLFISKASKLRDQLDEDATKNKRERNKANVKIAILDSQIKDVNELVSNKPNEDEFRNTLASLKTKKSNLVDIINQSNGIERDLIAQKSTLDREIIERS